MTDLANACRAILAGYAQDKSLLDDDMIDHAVTLADHAKMILDLLERAGIPPLSTPKPARYADGTMVIAQRTPCTACGKLYGHSPDCPLFPSEGTLCPPDTPPTLKA